MRERTLVTDLTTGKVAPQLLRYAAPFIASSLLQIVYNLVDMVVVGHFVGSSGLSAVGIGGLSLIFFTAFVIGFSAGGQIYISQIVGAKKLGELNRTIGTLFSLLFLTGLLLMAAGLLLTPVLLRLLNTPAEAYSQAKEYMTICSLGILFICGYNVLSAILKGMGESKLPLVFVLVATVVNVLLDLLFVGVLGMKAGGAALATIIGQAVSFLVSLLYLYRHRQSFGFDFKAGSFRMDRSVAGAILRLGLPMGIQQILIQTSMMFVNSRVNTCGLAASAIDAVGSKLNSMMGVVTLSMQSATSAMIGQNIAAGKTDRVSRIVWTNEAVCTTFLAFAAALLLLFPTQVIAIFNNEPEVLAMAPLYLRITVLFFATFAWMSATNGLIAGVGNARLNMILALADAFAARIGLTILLGDVLGLGLTGYWLGNATAGFTSVIVGAIYYFSGRWKHRTLLTDRV